MKIKDPKSIVISRTDSIGDVALTLPMAGILKAKYPEAKIIFLGRNYTIPIIKKSVNVDQFWNWDEINSLSNEAQLNWIKSKNIDVFIHVFPRKEIARLINKAKVKHRIGTSHRLFHIMTCNHRVQFSRKKSDLHEAQLNTKLLKPLGISKNFSLSELNSQTGFTNFTSLKEDLNKLINPNTKNIIFHSKSKGSALEWGVNNFIELAKQLDETKFTVFFSGTEEESKHFRHLLPKQNNIIDLSGKMSLDELITFISKSDILVAASTGPLHIAGLSNINTIGLFTTRRPLHKGRWQPLGEKVSIIEENVMSERNEELKISINSIKNLVNSIN